MNLIEARERVSGRTKTCPCGNRAFGPTLVGSDGDRYTFYLYCTEADCSGAITEVTER